MYFHKAKTLHQCQSMTSRKQCKAKHVFIKAEYLTVFHPNET